MKHLSLLLLIIGLGIQHDAHSVIYGVEERVFVKDINPTSPKAFLAKSVLGKLENGNSFFSKNRELILSAQTLSEKLNVCTDQKNADVSTAVTCSAFLVAPNLVMTAGHCLKDISDCKNSLWAFDYTSTEKEQKFSESQIVRCTEIIERKTDVNFDYALFRINKQIKNRTPLKFSLQPSNIENESMFIIGHPHGMPQVVMDNVSYVKNLRNHRFIVKADTAKGTSGAPVFNKIGEVIGLFNGGDPDFSPKVETCKKEIRCTLFNCHRGELVQYSWALPLKLIN